MADNAGSPIPVKVEEHSQSVILTYFQGDIGSMVDAHFSRALKTYKAKAKSKKSNKSVKSEKSNSCQWNAAPSTSYTETQFQPLAGHLGGVKEADAANVPFSPVGEPSSSWSSFPARQSGGLGFPPIGYSLSPDGLGVTGQQYATSLLNLLHNDRAEMGPSLASGSKPDLLQGWTAPTGFRDQVDPTGGFDPGRSLDKKHLYWY